MNIDSKVLHFSNILSFLNNNPVTRKASLLFNRFLSDTEKSSLLNKTESKCFYLSLIIHLLILLFFIFSIFIKNIFERDKKNVVVLDSEDFVIESFQEIKPVEPIVATVEKKIEIVDVDTNKDEAYDEDATFISHTNTKAQAMQTLTGQEKDNLINQKGIKFKDHKIFKNSDNATKTVNKNISQNPLQLAKELKKPSDETLKNEKVKETVKEEDKKIDERYSIDFENLVKSTTVMDFDKEKELKNTQQKDFAENKNLETSNTLPQKSEPEINKSSIDEIFDRKTEITSNSIRTGDENSISAKATATGKYWKTLRDVIGRSWQSKRAQYADLTEWGNLTVRFIVNKDGSISNLKIIIDNANGVMKSYTISAIKEAQIPPIPEEVLAEIGNEQLVVTYDFLLY